MLASEAVKSWIGAQLWRADLPDMDSILVAAYQECPGIMRYTLAETRAFVRELLTMGKFYRCSNCAQRLEVSYHHSGSCPSDCTSVKSASTVGSSSSGLSK